jgi:hypothetical protein
VDPGEGGNPLAGLRHCAPASLYLVHKNIGIGLESVKWINGAGDAPSSFDAAKESILVSLIDLLREKIERQMAAYDEQLEAAQAKAKAKRAQAEADVADAELEQQLLQDINDIKEKLAQGRAYLQEVAEAGEDKADAIRSKISRFLE